jgi:predicted GH43/DUF377 family glycosyl hydrolase
MAPMTVCIARRKLLGPDSLEPTRPGWRVVGAFNPAVVERPGGKVALWVRVAEQPTEERAGWIALPRWEIGFGPTVEWQPERDWQWVDCRVLRHRETGQVRLAFVSHLRLVDCGDGTQIIKELGRFFPQEEWEAYGVEDPRVTRCDGEYFMTYVAVSQWGICTALAVSEDGLSWHRLAIVFPPDNKDVVLFPQKVDSQFVAVHRPMPSARWSSPAMWMARSGDLRRWGDHCPLYRGSGNAWDGARVGAGPPPLFYQGQWWLIYHGSTRSAPGTVGSYAAGAVVLDGASPQRVVGYTPQPIMQPEFDYEQCGFVPRVVFPTGCVQRAGRLWVYYGAADTCTAVAELSMEALAQCVKPSQPDRNGGGDDD